jgi:histidinol-phosphatase (PHP family)
MTVMPPDYHIHTDFSCDCNVPMGAMCRAALAAGLSEIGFSEHLDLVPYEPQRDFFRAEAWWAELNRCRETFNGALQIKAGIELGEPHLFQSEIQTLLRAYPWDYTLASLHWVGAEMIFHRSYFDRSELDAYRMYFGELLRMVSEAEFDILAHMDIPKRIGFEEYGHYDATFFEAEIRPVLRTLVRRNIALEVNTGLLRRSVQETCPDLPILRWFWEEGGRLVTIGSDAHHTQDIGAGMAPAVKKIREAGFEEIALFERRSPRPTPILVETS